MFKRSKINIEIVDAGGTLSLTSNPKRDKTWHKALVGIEHTKENKTVLINHSDLIRFEEALVQQAYDVEQTPLLYRLFINRKKNSLLRLNWERIPEKIRENWFPFQKEDVERAVNEFAGKCFLAHDMGCGKSLISLGVVSNYRTKSSRHLIIVPSYLRQNWWVEVSTWLGHDAQVIFKTKDALTLNQFVIVSYDLAVRKLAEIQAIKWTTITADECHYLKSRTAKRTKLLGPLIQQCNHVLLLSGTPALSRPCELFTQFQALFPRTFKQFSLFAKRYCNLKKTVWGWDSSGSTNPDELGVLMASSMIRRLKRDVLKDLPKKTRRQITIPLSKKEKKELESNFAKLKEMNEILNKVVVADQETRNLAFQRQSLVSELFRCTARAKLKGVCDYVKGILQDNTDQKIILFGYHQITMNSLEQLISEQLKERFIRIDGKTPQMERQSLVDAFQDKDGPRIAILSIGACNSGITLTACHYTIFCELTWTPALMLQCEDRTHRIGATQVCHYDYLCAEDSLDERVLSKIQGKFGLLDQIIDGNANKDGFDILETEAFDRVFEEEEEEEGEGEGEGEEDVEPIAKRICV